MWIFSLQRLQRNNKHTILNYIMRLMICYNAYKGTINTNMAVKFVPSIKCYNAYKGTINTGPDTLEYPK